MVPFPWTAHVIGLPVTSDAGAGRFGGEQLEQRGGSPATLGARRLFGLLGQVLFELHELSHEVEVGRDDGSLGLEVAVRIHQGQSQVAHKVGHRYGWRAGDARVAVDQHTAAVGVGLV